MRKTHLGIHFLVVPDIKTLAAAGEPAMPLAYSEKEEEKKTPLNPGYVAAKLHVMLQ